MVGALVGTSVLLWQRARINPMGRIASFCAATVYDSTDGRNTAEESETLTFDDTIHFAPDLFCIPFHKWHFANLFTPLICLKRVSPSASPLQRQIF